MREEGSGPPVVMLHGGMADHRAVLPLVRPLTDRYRLITPDLRGSGRSWYGGELSFERWTDDLSALLDRAGIGRAVVGGVSSGSGAALHFALRHPARTRALVLVQPVHRGSALGYEEAQVARFAGMDALASRALEEGVAVLRPMYETLPEAIRVRALAMVESFDTASVVATSRFLASGRQPFGDARELEEVAMPTLVIRGNDPMHPASISETYVERIPGCRALPADTHPVADGIDAFLSSL